jgi:hypothetical protein
MYHDDYEPQHPMLKQMRDEPILMDNLPEPMRISSDIFERSTKCKTGGFLGIGAKLDPDGEAAQPSIKNGGRDRALKTKVPTSRHITQLEISIPNLSS